jgi:hypothetical protein
MPYFFREIEPNTVFFDMPRIAAVQEKESSVVIIRT